MSITRRLSMTQSELEALVRQAVETVVPPERISSLTVEAFTEDGGQQVVRARVTHPDLGFRATPDIRFKAAAAVAEALRDAGDDRLVVVHHGYDEGARTPRNLAGSKKPRRAGRAA